MVRQESIISFFISRVKHTCINSKFKFWALKLSIWNSKHKPQGTGNVSKGRIRPLQVRDHILRTKAHKNKGVLLNQSSSLYSINLEHNVEDLLFFEALLLKRNGFKVIIWPTLYTLTVMNMSKDYRS